MHPRQLTNEELADELQSLVDQTKYLGLIHEAAQRLVGKSQAAMQEASYHKPEFVENYQRKLLDLLEEHQLDDPDLLCRELQNIDEPADLNDFLDSGYWQGWDSDNRNNLPITDPDRAERCYEAAEDGADGSTHREVMGDWRKALNEAPSSEFGPISKMLLHRAITDCCEWHRKNGSLDDQLG